MREVLFVCEHGSAKSVVAAALYRRRAEELGESVVASARGTDPDERISANVLAGLAGRGLQPTEARPRELTQEDLERAGIIVTFGVDVDQAPEGLRRLRCDEIPPVSADFDAAYEAISDVVERILAPDGPLDR